MIASEAGALAWDVEGTKADFRDGSFTAYRVTDVR
jgi:hypothetical protein